MQGLVRCVVLHDYRQRFAAVDLSDLQVVLTDVIPTSSLHRLNYNFIIVPLCPI